MLSTFSRNRKSGFIICLNDLKNRRVVLCSVPILKNTFRSLWNTCVYVVLPLIFVDFFARICSKWDVLYDFKTLYELEETSKKGLVHLILGLYICLFLQKPFKTRWWWIFMWFCKLDPRITPWLTGRLLTSVVLARVLPSELLLLLTLRYIIA